MTRIRELLEEFYLGCPIQSSTVALGRSMSLIYTASNVKKYAQYVEKNSSVLLIR